MTSPEAWRARQFQRGDESAIAELARRVYPATVPEEYARAWQWKYLASPKGFSCWVAEADGRLVGHYASMILDATLQGQKLLISQVADAFVDPDWRGLGIFVSLGRKLLAELASRGVHISYGVPNQAAMPGHNRLSWVTIKRMPRYLAVLDQKKAIQQYTGGTLKRVALRLGSLATTHRAAKSDQHSLVPLSDGLRALETISRMYVLTTDFSIERTADYLDWRYSRSPLRRYRALVSEQYGAVSAVLVVGMTPTGTGQVVEFVVRPDRGPDGSRLLQNALSLFSTEGGHSAEAVASTQFTGHTLSASGFLRVSKLSLIAHANDAGGRALVSQMKRNRYMVFSLGDTDLA